MSGMRIYIGIVGGGFGALLVYTTLRFRGVKAGDMAVFAPERSPVACWQKFASAICQRDMRSESVGHFYPTDSPGLATVEAIRTFSLKPLVLSWFDRYHPTVAMMVEHIERVARQVGFFASYRQAMIGEVVKTEDGFQLLDMNGEVVGETQHVILAVGHGRLAIPDVVARFQERYPGDPRVISSYEPKQYWPQEVVLVVGDGLTAGTEWVNVLEHGGCVLGVSLSGFILNQPLNTPRKYFSKRGLEPYRNQLRGERVRELRAAQKGTLPTYQYGKAMYNTGRKEELLQLMQGELVDIMPTADHMLHCRVELHDSDETKEFCVDRVIYATGFEPVTTHPLMRKLIARYGLAMVGPYLEVDRRACVPALSTKDTCLSVMGAAAGWALPNADSIGGMKIAARAISAAVLGPEGWSPSEMGRKLWAWGRLMLGKELL